MQALLLLPTFDSWSQSPPPNSQTAGELHVLLPPASQHFANGACLLLCFPTGLPLGCPRLCGDSRAPGLPATLPAFHAARPLLCSPTQGRLVDDQDSAESLGLVNGDILKTDRSWNMMGPPIPPPPPVWGWGEIGSVMGVISAGHADQLAAGLFALPPP